MTPLIAAVAPSNHQQAIWIVERLEQVSGRSVAGTRVALLGMTFKAGTDDLRESPALRLAEVLVRAGAHVTAYDPVATEAGVAQLARGGISVTAAGSPAAAALGADAIVVGTEWSEFGRLDWAAIAPTMRGRVIADARRIVDRIAGQRGGADRRDPRRGARARGHGPKRASAGGGPDGDPSGGLVAAASPRS